MIWHFHVSIPDLLRLSKYDNSRIYRTVQYLILNELTRGTGLSDDLINEPPCRC